MFRTFMGCLYVDRQSQMVIANRKIADHKWPILNRKLSFAYRQSPIANGRSSIADREWAILNRRSRMGDPQSQAANRQYHKLIIALWSRQVDALNIPVVK